MPSAPFQPTVVPLRRPELSYRARRILYAVVSEYIATGEPVGSRRLSKRYGINLSPATIRNELADLEEAGCLAQPHHSAGRVPTEVGFRVFIDALSQMREVAAEDRAAILARMRQLRPGVDDVLREAGRLLASLTGAAALVSRPRTEVEQVTQIRFMPLSEKQVLAVIVTRSGTIQNRIVEVPELPDSGDMERIHNLLSSLLTERTLREVREELARAMADERGAYDRLGRRAKQMLDAATAGPAREEDVIIEGQGVLFDRPEFADAEKIRGFLRAFEEKEKLLDLLDRTLAAGGVQVLLGSEANIVDVPDVGVISANYRAGGVRAGSLGIIGPTRMDYAKLMPLVSFAAQITTDVLNGDSLRDDDDEPPLGEASGA
ncbi:heat-inducible transcriptional repressor HrcA [Sandaracinus amylolyticus]|uniref:heat-inducible transcriptional repressor HrcA n=1 Tax=Sandaracinus amylolyticus TaxID=927083 RepID=UPI0009FB73D2|nr:heat-inducible transcriptional repressor HrcA [Sandaracinus amylolyticus]